MAAEKHPSDGFRKAFDLHFAELLENDTPGVDTIRVTFESALAQCESAVSLLSLEVTRQKRASANRAAAAALAAKKAAQAKALAEAKTLAAHAKRKAEEKSLDDRLAALTATPSNPSK